MLIIFNSSMAKKREGEPIVPSHIYVSIKPLIIPIRSFCAASFHFKRHCAALHATAHRIVVTGSHGLSNGGIGDNTVFIGDTSQSQAIEVSFAFNGGT